MNTAQLETICDEHAGFDRNQFRLRLTVAPINHAGYSLMSDLDNTTRDAIQQVCSSAFARVIDLLKASQPAPKRRASDLITIGASEGQNP